MYTFVITFGLLLTAEKARERFHVSPFWAALIFIIPELMMLLALPTLAMMMLSSSVSGRWFTEFVSIGFVLRWVVCYVATVLLLCILSRYEDTIVPWAAILITGTLVIGCIQTITFYA